MGLPKMDLISGQYLISNLNCNRGTSNIHNPGNTVRIYPKNYMYTHILDNLSYLFECQRKVPRIVSLNCILIASRNLNESNILCTQKFYGRKMKHNFAGEMNVQIYSFKLKFPHAVSRIACQRI